MKKFLFLFLSILFFSFNSSNAQYLTTITPEPLIQKECVPGKNAFTFWTEKLMDPKITSVNTSINVYSFEGSTYFLIYGEEGKIDTHPLLIKVVGSCWKVIKNFRDNYYDPTGRNYVISVKRGDVLVNLDFFSNLNGRGAEFVECIWKKFPDSDFWKSKIQY